MGTHQQPPDSRQPNQHIRRVVGCMTGTSIDGIDVALVEIVGRGLAMRATLIRSLSKPLGELSAPLRRLADQHPMTAGEIARLSYEFSILHRDAIVELLGGDAVDLVSVHGQTVWHAPPTSWQMLTPAVIAHAVAAPLVSDLRAADLAAGGQGAPITPVADFILFRDVAESRGILNLGGFSNFTLLPRVPNDATADALATLVAQITGGDICSCNHLLNGLARRLLQAEYDENGGVALSGARNETLFDELCVRLEHQASSVRSLGSGDELAAWVEAAAGQDSAANVLRTACEAIAEIIVRRLACADRLLIGGGGGHNHCVIDALRRRCRCPVDRCDSFGVPVGMREAICMAILGTLSVDRVQITLPQITRRPSPAMVSGAFTAT